MKKLFIAAIAAATMMITGCDDKPSASTVETYSSLIGASAGMVTKLIVTDKEVVENINGILKTVDNVIPDEGKTFVEVWTPYVIDGVNKLKDSGKINDIKAKLISKGMEAVMVGLDRLFENKPTWKQYSDVVSGAITGFVAGFHSVIYDLAKGINNSRVVVFDSNEVKVIAERCGIKL